MEIFLSFRVFSRKKSPWMFRHLRLRTAARRGKSPCTYKQFRRITGEGCTCNERVLLFNPLKLFRIMALTPVHPSPRPSPLLAGGISVLISIHVRWFHLSARQNPRLLPRIFAFSIQLSLARVICIKGREQAPSRTRVTLGTLRLYFDVSRLHLLLSFSFCFFFLFFSLRFLIFPYSPFSLPVFARFHALGPCIASGTLFVRISNISNTCEARRCARWAKHVVRTESKVRSMNGHGMREFLLHCRVDVKSGPVSKFYVFLENCKRFGTNFLHEFCGVCGIISWT